MESWNANTKAYKCIRVLQRTCVNSIIDNTSYVSIEILGKNTWLVADEAEIDSWLHARILGVRIGTV